MAIKQKPVYVCDFCKREMDQPTIVTEDVPNEGKSEIRLRNARYTFSVGGQHYCGVDCLVEDIRKALDP